MDYEAFEKKHNRREAAYALVAEMRIQDIDDEAMRAGEIPGPAVVAALHDEWLPVGFWTCLSGKHPACGGPHGCQDRCTSEYWRRHCEDVASSLARLARRLGEDESLWRFTGLVHDLDYLKGMHHDPSADSDRAHPVAIARRMFELGVPPVAVCAVLEHSPHLGLPPSSRLSHALIACDEHATMTAEGLTPSYPDDIPNDILECMTDSTADMDGFYRDDMLQRATSNLRALAA